MFYIAKSVKAKGKGNVIFGVHCKTFREKVVKDKGFSLVKLLSFKQVRRVPVLEPKVSEELLQTFPAHKHCVSPHSRTKSCAKSDFNVALKTGPYEAVHLYL